MSRTACFALVALLASTTPSPATQSSGTPQASFRAGIELIQVDVSVLGEDGNPVRGLTQSDFTILEDGKPRPVASFAAVEVAPPAPPPAVWMSDSPPDVTTNDLLPVVPTARRVFRPTDRVTVFARGYQGGRHAAVPATATARIVDAANKEVFKSETPLGAQASGALRSADYRLALPVDRLGPGHYLLTVSVSAASGASERSLSFQIR